MTTLVSGWYNTDIMNFVDCPNCGQPAGKVCRMPKGRRLSTPHIERSIAYKKAFPDRDYLYKGGPGVDHLGNVRDYNHKLLGTYEEVVNLREQISGMINRKGH